MRELLRASAFLLGLSWRTDRRRLLGAAALMFAGYAATPLIAVALKTLANDVLAANPAAVWAAMSAAVLLVFELMMAHFAHLAYFELGELEEMALNSELIALAGGAADLGQIESPRFADTLTLVHADLVKTREAVAAVLQLAGVLTQIAITTGILAAVSPLLTVLLLAAFPPVLAGRKAQALVDRAKEATAEQVRTVNHLLRLATTPGTVKELSVCLADEPVLALAAQAWSRIVAAEQAAHLRAALVRAAGQTAFAAAYAAAILLVSWQALRGQARVGDVILILTLAVQVNAQVSGALGLLPMLQGAGRTAHRLTRLRAEADAHSPRIARPPLVRRPHGQHSDTPMPARLRQGIRLVDVSFTYPGNSTPALRDVTLDLPARGMIAVVGENGAGKSTLVKLLCGLYQPTAGRIEADGTAVPALSSGQWRGSLAVLFQDFARIELSLGESVGVGDLARLDDGEAILAALRRAQAGTIAVSLPGGLSGLLGTGYGDGAELSGGQWQSVGLARALMRRDPRLLILDEPAAALDAAAAAALAARYTESGRRAGQAAGTVTIVISHRLATVRMADLIVVLDHGRVVESGRHEDLIEAKGQYAELFELHARGYR